ncbi:MAG: pantetheine-phosphate adenylyltransferase [Armatimonadota bacterium]
MRLIFLGAGGSMATPFRHTTGLYLPDHGILLDAGTNVYPLRELHGDGPLRVLMSHFHADHSIGLFFLSAGLFAGRSQPEIEVFGPERWDRFRDLGGDESALWPIPLPFPVRPAEEDFTLGGVRVRTHPVKHSAPVLAYRLDFPSGESLGYVTDTTAPGDYVELIRGVDVLVHECTFAQQHAEWAVPTGHSESATVGRVAREAGVGTLYLTHIGPLSDGQQILAEVQQEFPNTVLPVDCLEYPRAVSVDPKRALFAGSFDPITMSHLDIVDACTRMLREVHVVVARNPVKDGRALFTPEERAELIRRCVPRGVQVGISSGLTVEYARSVQAGTIVRGLGRAEDYFGEVRLFKTNALLESEIQTLWVPPRAEHLDISSSMIKEAGIFGGWESVAHLVPEPIREDVGRRLQERRATLSIPADGD